MLVDDLHKKMMYEMKSGDRVRANTIRNLISELKNAQIDNPNMSEEDETVVVKKEAKKRRDSIEAFGKAGRQDLVDIETAELRVLEEFMPPEMDDGELTSIVHEAIIYTKAGSMADMGRVMGEVMKRVEGRASGDRVAAIVKSKLLNGNT